MNRSLKTVTIALLLFAATVSAETDEEKFARLISQTPDVNILLRGTPHEQFEESKLYRALGFALVGTAVSDVVSTEYVIRGGGHETNPLGPNLGARIALKSASTVLVWRKTNRLHSEGHTRAALWIRIATVAVWGYATAHNLRLQ